MNVETALKESKIRHLDLSPLVYVELGTKLSDVVQVMKTERAGCVLVCESDCVKGIFTERDLLAKVIGAPVDSEAPIDEFMTPEPRTLRLDDSVGDAILVMHEGGYRHVPLVDEQGRVTGLLGVPDLIHFLAEYFPDEVLNLPPRIHQRLDAPDGA
ncbi:MAG: CBS domain-containing protein [Acidobacteria bacterium]|nr:CBS domain-containing protein [Acidobacteriota bacterium]